jgi:hypothetical protein
MHAGLIMVSIGIAGITAVDGIIIKLTRCARRDGTLGAELVRY